MCGDPLNDRIWGDGHLIRVEGRFVSDAADDAGGGDDDPEKNGEPGCTLQMDRRKENGRTWEKIQ